MQVRSLSRILSLSLAFEVRRDGFSFSRLVISLSTVIRHVRDILNYPAAGVCNLCPTFHGFRVPGYACDFVWAISVTHEGCLNPDVRLQEKTSNEHDNRDPPAPTFRLLYTWGRDFFNVFYIAVYSRPMHFSLLKSFCSSISDLLAYKL